MSDLAETTTRQCTEGQLARCGTTSALPCVTLPSNQHLFSAPLTLSCRSSDQQPLLGQQDVLRFMLLNGIYHR